MNFPKLKDVYGLDIENDGDKLICASIWSVDKTIVFYSKEEFWKEIKKYKYRGNILFATNLEYDLGFLMDGMEEEKQLKVFRRGGRLIFAKLPVHGGRDMVTFSDTLNFTPAGVYQLGLMIGYPKLNHITGKEMTDAEWKGEKEYKMPTSKEGWERMIKYNIRDSEISARYMIKLKESLENLGAKIKITASSTSLDFFKKHYAKDLKIKPSKFADDEMKAYYGGRTEVFRRGSIENINVYDINSMYPAVMRNNVFPDPNTGKRCIDSNLEGEGISRCIIESPSDIKIPLLPVRTHKVIFPKGKWSGWYCHPELRKAKELGYKIKVLESIIYECKPYFYNFMDDLYDLRLEYKKENNKIMEQTVKLLMNSLYGKFAIKLECEEEIHKSLLSVEQYMEYLDMGYEANGRGFFHVKSEMAKPPKYRMPILSAYTTCYARLELYRFFEELNFKVDYCDTDSVFSPNTLKTGDKLGEMKLEYSGNAILIKPKMYFVDIPGQKPKIKCKGLGRIIKTKEDFDKILNQQVINFQRLAKVRESRVNDYWYGQPIKCHKLMGLEDDKRIWDGMFTEHTFQCSKPLIYTA